MSAARYTGSPDKRSASQKSPPVWAATDRRYSGRFRGTGIMPEKTAGVTFPSQRRIFVSDDGALPARKLFAMQS